MAILCAPYMHCNHRLFPMQHLINILGNSKPVNLMLKDDMHFIKNTDNNKYLFIYHDFSTKIFILYTYIQYLNPVNSKIHTEGT